MFRIFDTSKERVKRRLDFQTVEKEIIKGFFFAKCNNVSGSYFFLLTSPTGNDQCMESRSFDI